MRGCAASLPPGPEEVPRLWLPFLVPAGCATPRPHPLANLTVFPLFFASLRVVFCPRVVRTPQPFTPGRGHRFPSAPVHGDRSPRVSASGIFTGPSVRMTSRVAGRTGLDTRVPAHSRTQQARRAGLAWDAERRGTCVGGSVLWPAPRVPAVTAALGCRAFPFALRGVVPSWMHPAQYVGQSYMRGSLCQWTSTA